MARDSIRKASRAIRRKASEEAQRQHRAIRYAEVTAINPLIAEVNEGGFVLDDDDLVLSKWAQQYDTEYGIEAGDSLLVHPMKNGDWLVTDVIGAATTASLSGGPPTGAAGGALAGSYPDPDLDPAVAGGGLEFHTNVVSLNAGLVMSFPGDAAQIPAGFLLCDGSAVSRGTYSRLFAAIGEKNGPGNGSSTFNLPDYRDKFPKGATNDAEVGTTGGAATVTLTSAQIPAHTHGVSGITVATESAHTHGIGSYVAANESAHTHGIGSYVAANESAHTHGIGTYVAANESAHTHGFGTLATDSQTPTITVSDGGHTHTSGTLATDSQTPVINDTHRHTLNLASDNTHTGTGNVLTNVGGSGAQTGTPPSTGSITNTAHSHAVNSGSTGAASSTSNTSAKNAAHSHAVTSGATGAGSAHTHTLSGTSGAGSAHTHTLSGTSGAGSAHTHTLSGTSGAGSAHTHALSGATDSAGTDGSHPNVPPWQATHYIISTGGQ